MQFTDEQCAPPHKTHSPQTFPFWLFATQFHQSNFTTLSTWQRLRGLHPSSSLMDLKCRLQVSFHVWRGRPFETICLASKHTLLSHAVSKLLGFFLWWCLVKVVLSSGGVPGGIWMGSLCLWIIKLVWVWVHTICTSQPVRRMILVSQPSFDTLSYQISGGRWVPSLLLWRFQCLLLLGSWDVCLSRVRGGLMRYRPLMWLLA